MRVTRKLFLVSALALTALVIAASSASAVTIQQEPNNNPCPAGPTLVQHVVTGGCHVTFNDTDGIPFLLHTGAAEVQLSNCTVSLEVRVNSAGIGYATNQVFGDVLFPGSCTRRPCDELNMAKLAWSTRITSTTSLESIFCLRTAASGEAGMQTLCHIVLPIFTNGHVHFLGAIGVEYQCEGVPLEITDVELVSPTPVGPGERVEIS